MKSKKDKIIEFAQQLKYEVMNEEYGEPYFDTITDGLLRTDASVEQEIAVLEKHERRLEHLVETTLMPKATAKRIMARKTDIPSHVVYFANLANIDPEKAEIIMSNFLTVIEDAERGIDPNRKLLEPAQFLSKVLEGMKKETSECKYYSDPANILDSPDYLNKYKLHVLNARIDDAIAEFIKKHPEYSKMPRDKIYSSNREQLLKKAHELDAQPPHNSVLKNDKLAAESLAETNKTTLEYNTEEIEALERMLHQIKNFHKEHGILSERDGR